ncbi:MAG: hypothetical protein HPKKFMNG_01316 [Planctomycetes bacterium]|nr:hypothetical protein [Planctomycetota bacterium]
MRATEGIVDVVAVGVRGHLAFALGPLEGDLDLDLVGLTLVHDLVGIDHVVMDARLVAVMPGHELLDALLEVEQLFLALFVAVVHEFDVDALAQEGQFAQARGNQRQLEFACVKNLVVGKKGDARARVVGLINDLQVGRLLAARKLDHMFLAALPHGHARPGRACVNGLEADAVQAAGRVVCLALELAAGVQVGKHHLDAGFSRLLVDADGNAVAVVGHGAGAVLVNLDGDMVAPPRQSFVHGVCHDLEHEVMQAVHVTPADVHVRALADAFEAFQLDQVVGLILTLDLLALLGSFRHPCVRAGFRLVHVDP